MSLSRLLRTEKPFKNIFFYAVARHEMMVSGYEKNVAEFLDISFFYGPWTLRTKSFLIDGGWWCCWVIQKLWRESKAKLCHQKIQYLHSWSWLERKENLEKIKFQESFHRSKKESQSGKDAHTLWDQKKASKQTIFSKIPTGKRICLLLRSIYLCFYRISPAYHKF